MTDIKPLNRIKSCVCAALPLELLWASSWGVRWTDHLSPAGHTTTRWHSCSFQQAWRHWPGLTLVSDRLSLLADRSPFSGSAPWKSYVTTVKTQKTSLNRSKLQVSWWHKDIKVGRGSILFFYLTSLNHMILENSPTGHSESTVTTSTTLHQLNGEISLNYHLQKKTKLISSAYRL